MKKKIIIISSIIMVLILVVLYLLFKKGYIEYFYTSSNDYLLLKDEVPDFESEIESGYVFKNYDDFKNKTNSNKLTEKDFKRFNKNDNDGKGYYSLNPVSGPGGARKGNPYYEFLGVEDYFRFSKKSMQEMYESGKVVKVNNNQNVDFLRTWCYNHHEKYRTWFCFTERYA